VGASERGDAVVLPGYADYVDLLGYLVERCPECGQVGPFAVYRARRKLTITFVPTVNIGERRIMECRTCGARFAVPDDLSAALPERLLTQEQLSARIRELRAARASLGGGAGAAGPAPGARPRTAYQVLQVDPSADPEVVEAAFKRLAFKYHPDRSDAPDAAARMRELLEARGLLTDPDRRRAYDAALGLAPRPAPPPRSGSPPAPPAPNRPPDPRPSRREPPPGPSAQQHGGRSTRRNGRPAGPAHPVRALRPDDV